MRLSNSYGVKSSLLALTGVRRKMRQDGLEPRKMSYCFHFTSAPSSLNIRVDLSRFFCLAKRGDRGKHSNVSEIERKARREKIDEDTLIFKLDGALAYCG